LAHEEIRYNFSPKKFFLTILLTVIAGIWGFLSPSSWTLSSRIGLLGISISAYYVFIVLLILSLLLLLLGFLGFSKDWQLQISSHITIKSREILIFGGLLILLTAFSFNGFDILLFFVYYYEIILIRLYTLISITLLPTILIIISGVVIFLLGIILRIKQSSLKFRKWTLPVEKSSTLLIAGVVSLLLCYFVFTLYQPGYVEHIPGWMVISGSDGIYDTIEDLPFPSILITHLLNFYLDDVIFFYPLIILICGIYFLRLALRLPSTQILSTEYKEILEAGPPKIVGRGYQLSKWLFRSVVALFILLFVQWALGLTESEWFLSIYNLEIMLFSILISFLLLTVIISVLVYMPHALKPFFDDRVFRYAGRRLLTMIPMFIGISIISYTLMLSTGNPVDLILAGYTGKRREEIYMQLTRIFGLDLPPQAQWFNWFFHLIMGDMGTSIIGGRQVADQIAIRIIPTLQISLIPLLLALLISIPIGIAAALRQYSWTDNIIAIFVSIGLSVPIFLVILIIIIIFSYYIPILPPGGYSIDYVIAVRSTLVYAHMYIDTFIKDIISWELWDLLWHLIIPLVVVTLVSLALYTRLVRSGLLEILQQDYILSAQAYGFSERTIIYKHAIRNVMIPLITFVGLSIGGLLGGAPLTETTLGWPGLGEFGVRMILAYDYPVVMGLIMVTAILILIANLLTDIIYSVIDPRVYL